MLKKILIVGLLLLLIGGGIVFYLLNKKVPGLKYIKADFALTADELMDEMLGDETAATAKYNEKVIEVTGKVLSTSSSDTTFVVMLEAVNSEMGGVNCSFKGVPENASQDFAEGKTAALKGRFTGYDHLLSNVQLKECVPAR